MNSNTEILTAPKATKTVRPPKTRLEKLNTKFDSALAAQLIKWNRRYQRGIESVTRLLANISLKPAHAAALEARKARLEETQNQCQLAMVSRGMLR